MRKVEPGNVCLMFASGLGVVGIGIVGRKTGSTNVFESLEEGDPSQIWEIGLKRERISNGPKLPEWRIHISEWHFWDKNQPIRYSGRPIAFGRADARQFPSLDDQIDKRLDFN
ncbi:MAG: hypothetical protein WD045_03675 [Pirellulaceae bacterium]